MAERKKTATEAVDVTAEAVQEVAAPVEETAPVAEVKEEETNEVAEVPVRLVYDDDHKRPLYVCVNGIAKRIPRGRTVMVPPEFAAAVESAMEQEENSVRYSDAMAYKDPDVN